MERQELEDLWRRRLQEAQLRLEFATSYVDEFKRSFPLSDTSPDGQTAYERALRAQNVALGEYNRVLRIFSELVLDGKVPESGRGES